MSLFIASRVSLIWKRVTKEVYVSHDNVAKLMYYIDCVKSVANVQKFEPNISRFTEYQTYYTLTKEEIDCLLDLCEKLRPEVLEGSCFFKCPDLCVEFQNEFYEEKLESLLVALHTSEEELANAIFIGACSVEITKRMVYKDPWMDENYHQPMERLRPWLDAAKSNKPRPVIQCKVKIQPRDPFADIVCFSDNVSANILISYIFPFWILGWILMVSMDFFMRKRTDFEAVKGPALFSYMKL